MSNCYTDDNLQCTHYTSIGLQIFSKPQDREKFNFNTVENNIHYSLEMNDLIAFVIKAFYNSSNTKSIDPLKKKRRPIIDDIKANTKDWRMPYQYSRYYCN